MSLNIAYTILLQDQFSEKAKKVADAMQRITRDFKVMAKEASASTIKMKHAMGAVAAEAEISSAAVSGAMVATSSRFSRSMRFMTGNQNRIRGFGHSLRNFITLPLLGIAAAALHTHAKFQTLETAFAAMLHSESKASKLMTNLKNFAAGGVFTFTDVAQAGRMLMAANVPLDTMRKRLTMLGDIAAGTGAHITDIAADFAQVKMRGRVYMTDISMMLHQGVDLFGQLRRGLGLTTAQLTHDLRTGAISFKVYKEALASMTTKSGKFYNQIQKHLNTLLGAGRKLKDNFVQFLDAIGAGLDQQGHVTKHMLNLAEALRSVTKQVGPWIKAHKGLVAILIKIGVILAVAGPLLMGLSMVVKAFKVVSDVVKGVKMAFTMLLSPTFWIIAAIAILAVSAYEIYKNWGPIMDWWHGSMKKMSNQFPATYAIIKFFSDATVLLLKAIWYIIGKIPQSIEMIWQAFKDLSSLVGAIGGLLAKPFIWLYEALSYVDRSVNKAITSFKSFKLPSIDIKPLDLLKEALKGIYDFGQKVIGVFKHFPSSVWKHIKSLKNMTVHMLTSNKAMPLSGATIATPSAGTLGAASAVHQTMVSNNLISKDSKAKAELHISVDDKAGHVKNMQLKSTGSTGFSLGHNMAHATGGTY
jgi:tape measure domain-containing protein